MTCPHSQELKGKALLLRSNRHTTNSKSLHVAAAVACIEEKRVHQEKSHCTGTKQQIPSMFAHHLINASGSVPGVVLFQGWMQPSHHSACYCCLYIEDF